MRIVEHSEIAAIRGGAIPRHLAVIMDGNGRWAQMRGLPRTEGHRMAEEAVVATVEACLDLGVGWLTAYAFSTENWARDAAEVSFLMSFEEWLLHEERRDELNSKGVQIRFVGRLDDARIPPKSRSYIQDTMDMTSKNERLVLSIAFNYGGRAELVDAVRQLVSSNTAPEDIDETALARAMYAGDMPDMDLLLRTSAEHRLSNFFPWHTTYAELIFTDTLWPDIRAGHVYSAVDEYQRRRRRLGTASG